MCGIIGYIGKRNAVPVIMNGLKRLEYRGYDSAGIAYLDSAGELKIVKIPGKINRLQSAIENENITTHIAIGHTRWATHGEPTHSNAHPHSDCNNQIAVIHNGIIENYQTLKEYLTKNNHRFASETDTEMIVHLIEENVHEGFENSVFKALPGLIGTYGILLISSLDKTKIIAARNGSPLLIGIGKDGNFIASDPAAFVGYTRDVIYLEDGEVALIKADDVETRTVERKEVKREREKITISLQEIEKSGYEHFMLKEICEQPQSITDSFRGRIIKNEGMVKLGGIQNVLSKIKCCDRIIITGCGTSWHAGLIGEYLIEDMYKVPVEVEYASEFRYRDPVITKNDVLIAISQSGETADTLAAVKEAKRKDALVLGICNVVGSSIARATDAGIFIHAGPEIGVASTKAFTSQVVVLFLFALLLARMKDFGELEGKKAIKELEEISSKVNTIIGKNEDILRIARKYASKKNFLYLGRGYNFPVALEGALKLKEISYIHAEGYPAAEMKHGPIALIDEDMPVVFIAIKDGTYEKVLSNIEEVKARKGKVIAIAFENDEYIRCKADEVIYIPETIGYLTPLLTVIPLQLLAYHIAVIRGCDVDQPRNLAKSVTVE